MITQPIQYNSSATGLSLCFQLDNRTPLRIFNYHWNTSPHKVTVMQIKSHNPTQITLIPMNDHSNNPIPIQCYLTATVLPIGPNNATQITIILMNEHSTNPIAIQCLLTVKVVPIGPNNATQIISLPINDHSTNPILIQCHLTVTVLPIGQNNATQIALLPMNGHSSYPIQSNANQTKQCHSDNFTANEWPLDQSNTNPVPLDCQGDANQTRKYTQITLLPMNDHLTNPIPVQCHSTVTVLPIRPHHANQITLLPKKDQGDAN